MLLPVYGPLKNPLEELLSGLIKGHDLLDKLLFELLIGHGLDDHTDNLV